MHAELGCGQIRTRRKALFLKRCLSASCHQHVMCVARLRSLGVFSSLRSSRFFHVAWFSTTRQDFPVMEGFSSDAKHTNQSVSNPRTCLAQIWPCLVASDTHHSGPKTTIAFSFPARTGRRFSISTIPVGHACTGQKIQGFKAGDRFLPWEPDLRMRQSKADTICTSFS